MSVLQKIAFYQNRRDEVPNQLLASELVDHKNHDGVREIASNLWHTNPKIQSDCLKVLYEIGYLDPTMTAGYADDFLKLLRNKNNRLVWGSMIALSTIAQVNPEVIYPHHEEIMKAMERGSVITVDNGVITLALLAVGDDERSSKLFPYLLKHLETCRPKDVPQHSEKTLIAVNSCNKIEFIRVLERRMPSLKAPQAARVNKVIKQAEQR